MPTMVPPMGMMAVAVIVTGAMATEAMVMAMMMTTMIITRLRGSRERPLDC
jgi:hypothetical protein